MAIEHVVNRLGQQFGERLPAPLRGMREELEGTVKSLLRDALSRMDLLTRDEFDIQQTLLARTRARVDDLEQQLRQLEQQLTALEQPPR
ncbi:accessory factor UbiK family protein [Perlucidibaca piscinae]|uniref:accessory factor UbiK family protein n=1 Tax=Perlucidibaca piscinae TaxID=392589 RepID=UPI0003B39934|nr:accessory factor UbiK family protein [Perlucidibaca piscinae]